MSGFIDEGKQIGLAEAIFDNESDWRDELAFQKGDILRVLETNPAQGSAQGWWVCANQKGGCGIAPANRLKMVDEAEFFRNLGINRRRPFDDFALSSDYDFLSRRSFFGADPFFMNRNLEARLRPTEGYVDGVDSLTANMKIFRPLQNVNHPFNSLSDRYKSTDSSDIDELMLTGRKPQIRHVPINVEPRAPTPINARHHRPKSPPAPPLRRHLPAVASLDPPLTNSSEEEELRNALSNRNASWYDRLPFNEHDQNGVYSTLTNRAERGVAQSSPFANRSGVSSGFSPTNQNPNVTLVRRSMGGVQTDSDSVGCEIGATTRPASGSTVTARTPSIDRNGNGHAFGPFALYDQPPSLRKSQNRVNRVRFAQDIETGGTVANDSAKSPSHFAPSSAHFRSNPSHIPPSVLKASSSGSAHFNSSPAPFSDAASSSDRSSNSTTVSSISDALPSTSSSLSADGATAKKSTDFFNETNNFELPKDGAVVDAKKFIDENLYDVPKSLNQLLKGFNESTFSTDSSNISVPQQVTPNHRRNSDWIPAGNFLGVDCNDGNAKSNPHESALAYEDDYDFVDNSQAFQNCKNSNLVKQSSLNNVEDSTNFSTVKNCDVRENGDSAKSGDVIVKCGDHGDDDCVEIARFYAPQIKSQCELLGVAIDDFLASAEPPGARPPGSEPRAGAGQSMVREMVSRARFLVLAAHKLVYLGDSLAHCASKRPFTASSASDRAATVASPCDRLCAALRRFVVSTKRACAEWPRVEEARDMYDCVLQVSTYSRELALASSKLTSRS